MVFTSLPVPADVEAVALGPNGLIEGMRPDTAFFDMSTNSVAVVRKINAAFAEKNLYMLDSPVSGGPGGAAAARWRSGSAATSSSSTATSSVLDAMGDQAALYRPDRRRNDRQARAQLHQRGGRRRAGRGYDDGHQGRGRRRSNYGRRCARARPVASAPSTGSASFSAASYDPADFALRLLHKDVSLAVGLGKEVAVPMRLANLALEELTEAMNRGWQQRDSRVGGLLQVERSGIEPLKVDPADIQAVLDGDK